jgi:hyperosmotically inducible periplasmic protein
MRLRNFLSHFIVCLLAITVIAAQTTNSCVIPANSATQNKKPSAGIPLTAGEKKNNTNSSDRQIAQTIQHAIKNNSASKYAHNVKVICQNGMVILRGPVVSENQKQDIGEKAADVVGSNHVVNELAITPEK